MGYTVTIYKWRDKREVLVLSTVQQGSGEIEKPGVISDYNWAKSYIGLEDQIKAYTHCLCRGTKWYRKLAIEILLGSVMVNAHLIYKVIQEKISIIEFREKLCLYLLGISNTPETTQDENNAPESDHVL